MVAIWAGWPRPWLHYADGHYFGWRHRLIIGPAIIFWGLMTEAELRADAAAHEMVAA